MNTLRSVVVVIVFAIPVHAQESAGVRGEVPGTRKRLVAAEEFLRSGQADKAREALTAIIDDAGDDLIQRHDGEFISARTFANTLLAKLPEEQLNIYRARIKDAADKLLAEGIERRDPSVLQELVDRYFVSHAAAEALNSLGEMAFERGEYTLAERYWSRLVPSAEFCHPGQVKNLASIEAQIVHAILFQHDDSTNESTPRVAQAFTHFEKKYPDSKGHLAGRDGALVDILRDEINRKRKIPSPLTTPSDWQTLGANAARTGAVPGSLRALPSSPVWTSAIPGVKRESRPRLGTVRRVAFHPVLNETHAYVADATRITGFDLKTGRAFAVFDSLALRPQARRLKDAVDEPTWRDADFTLTLADGRIYARMGGVAVIPGEPASASHLVCVSHTAGTSQLHWSRKPPVAAGILAGWEGTPIVVGERLLAAYSRVEGGRMIQAIACYGSADKPLWITDVCELGLGAAEARERHELLTLAGDNVVFASHTGVIAAVRLRNGKPAWSRRYAHVVTTRHRDISPPVAMGGAVFIAPNDSDRLFALDAATGGELWRSQPLAVDHLIGVCGTRVIAAIAGPNRGLRAFDARTGSTTDGAGWQQHDDPTLPTFGRGAIVGDLIAWPTQDGLYLIRIQDGQPAKAPLPHVHGNIAFAGGTMLVASADSLACYTVPDSGRHERRSPPIAITSRKPLPPRPKPNDSPLTLLPLLSTSASCDAVRHARPGRSFQAPQNHAWAEGPTLYDALEYAEGAIYRGSDVLLIDSSSLHWLTLDGQSLWSLSLPSEQPMPWSVKLAGDRIVARVGERHFRGVSLVAPTQDWIESSTHNRLLSRFQIESAPRFDACFLADEIIVAARQSSGRVWIMDSATGERISTIPCDCGTWTTPPVRLTDSLIAIPTGPGTLQAYDTRARTIRWTWDAGRTASLAGIAPQLQSDGKLVNVLIARNHGCELQRLSADGRSRWSESVFLTTDDVHLSDAGSDDQRLYLPLGQRVMALQRDSGAMLWETLLPVPVRWRMLALGNAIAAIPCSLPLPSPRLPVAILKYPFHALAASFHDVIAPVVLLDPATGRILQKLDTFDGPLISATVQSDGLWLATARTIYRVK